ATQVGWPKASVLNMHGTLSMIKIAEQRDEPRRDVEFEPWTDPVEDDVRRERGEAAFRSVHGVAPSSARTAFRGRAYLDFLYGEVWTRDRFLSRRDRRVVSICCCGATRVDEETREHLRAALVNNELTFEELQELVMHYTVYVGWPLGRHLDDMLVEVA